jgi:hypothetical protein
LFVYGPIPSPRDWLISADEPGPPGYLRLASIAPPRAAANPGSNLVPREDIEALPSQIERLLQAFAKLDAGSRVEVVSLAERLA